MNISSLVSYWWVIPIFLVIVFWKSFLRLFLGVVIVPEDKLGLITKKFNIFGKNSLPDGKIIATDGEPGFQARTLGPGLYFRFWPWQFHVKLQEFTVIAQGEVGLISSKDGVQLNQGSILARKVDCDNFQDAEKFLRNGGQKGKQISHLTPGVYRINTYAFEVSRAKMTNIPVGKIGVVTTLDGEQFLMERSLGRKWRDTTISRTLISSSRTKVTRGFSLRLYSRVTITSILGQFNSTSST